MKVQSLLCTLALFAGLVIAGAPAADAQACSANQTVITAAELDLAIACYNAQTPVGDHTITFGSDIAHLSGATQIDQPSSFRTLTIEGAGFTLAGPGKNSIAGDQINLIDHFSPGTLAINNLTITQADEDGVFVFDGDTTISDSTIHDNHGAGIFISSVTSAVLTGSTVFGNNDGIFSRGFTRVSSSTVHNNTDGIFVQSGAMSISDSTIHNNNDGIFIQGDWVSVSNSTIHQNNDGIFLQNGSLWVSNSTLHNNGDGIYVQGDGLPVEVTSSIIDDSCDFFNSVLTDGLNNFAATDDTTCGFEKLTPGSLSGVLADNGGATQTVALVPGSNAADSGRCEQVSVGLDPTGIPVLDDLAFDQRGVGFDRTSGVDCDAGAFEAPCGQAFADVNGGLFYSEAVAWAACTGITSGTSLTSFSPSGIVTRAQMATFLWRYAGRPLVAATHSFTDVPAGKYYSEPVAWLAASGITTGTTATTFSPHTAVTRAQMATFLWRLNGSPTNAPESAFVDVVEDSFYDIAVDWMFSKGITTGTTTTTYSPTLSLNRAQAVTFLNRLANLPR